MMAAFVLFLVPVAAIAAAGFTDVDDDSVFVADIQWMKDNGITKGCNPPTNDRFCPGSYVTREQMAAFMHRLAHSGAVDAGSVGGVNVDSLVQKADTIVIPQSATNWVPLGNNNPATTLKHSARLVVSADGNIVMGLTPPVLADGTEYRLTGLAICYAGLSPGNGYVTSVKLQRAPYFDVFNDHTPIVSSGCVDYSMDVSPNGESLYLFLYLGGGAEIEIESVKTAWSAP